MGRHINFRRFVCGRYMYRVISIGGTPVGTRGIGHTSLYIIDIDGACLGIIDIGDARLAIGNIHTTI